MKGKVIKLPVVIQKEENIKQLSALVKKYLPNDKKRTIEKIKKEQ